MSGAQEASARRRTRLPPGIRAKRLTNIEVGELSIVDVPANQGARQLLFKNLEGQDPGQAKTSEELAEELAAALALVAERDAQLAFLADRVAALAEAQPEPVPAKVEAPPPPVAEEPPARSAYDQEDVNLLALAMLARDSPHIGSRRTWRGELARLGRHLAPDLPEQAQLNRAMQDERGLAFLTALQSRPA